MYCDNRGVSTKKKGNKKNLFIVNENCCFTWFLNIKAKLCTALEETVLAHGLLVMADSAFVFRGTSKVISKEYTSM